MVNSVNPDDNVDFYTFVEIKEEKNGRRSRGRVKRSPKREKSWERKRRKSSPNETFSSVREPLQTKD